MTKDRLDIRRQVYEHLLTKEEVARKYGVSIPCIYVYVSEYKRCSFLSYIGGLEPRTSLATAQLEEFKCYVAAQGNLFAVLKNVAAGFKPFSPTEGCQWATALLDAS